MSQARLFAVTVTFAADAGQTDLLSMASVLHRRAVEVLDAELSRPVEGRRVFAATFLATPRHALTVLRSFENVVDVTSARLDEVRADQPPGAPMLAAGEAYVRNARS